MRLGTDEAVAELQETRGFSRATAPTPPPTTFPGGCMGGGPAPDVRVLCRLCTKD